MFNNVYVETSTDKLLVNTFWYNSEKHMLKIPLPMSDNILTMENVECDIKTDKPMIYITVRPYKG